MMKIHSHTNIGKGQAGLTLIELMIVIIIIGILAGVSMRSIQRITENFKFNETIAEMDQLAYAIVGNPNVVQNNIRIDYGYVGDTGVMPATLEDLFTNNAGVAGWEGPYIDVGFDSSPLNYMVDAWGITYTYVNPTNLAETPMILTPADGDTIDRDIASSVNSILNNTLLIRPYDVDNNMINGTNGVVEVHYSGVWNNMPYDGSEHYFESTTVPIGLHQVRVISAGDTAYKAFSVEPSTTMRSPTQMTVYPEYGAIEYVATSYLLGGTNNNELTLEIENTGSPTYYVTRVKVELTSQTNDCLDCEYPYLDEFSIGLLEYWKWNTAGRSSMVPNGAWITLDNTMNVYTGIKVLGPILFEDASDGTGDPIDLRAQRISIELSPRTGPKQEIIFTTTGSCLPASISYYAWTSDSNSEIVFEIRNSGDLDVQINSITVESDATGDTYLDMVEIPNGTNVWDASSCGVNRPKIDNSTGNVTFCLNTPVTVTGGGGTSTMALTMYDALTGTVDAGPFTGFTFDITFDIECGSNQSIQFTVP